MQLWFKMKIINSDIEVGENGKSRIESTIK